MGGGNHANFDGDYEIVDAEEGLYDAEEVFPETEPDNFRISEGALQEPVGSGATLSQPTRLFNLIEIKADRQDLKFVEKVVLSRKSICELSNILAPGSIELSRGRWILDARSLDNSSISTVGVYGNKEIMTKLLLEDGMLLDEDVDALRNDSLPPGLYGSLSKKRLLLFYWPPVKKFTDARRGDISCNFVRYLVDLCDTVHCCMDVESSEFEDFGAALETKVKKKRTQRLQISVVKSSENDFTVQTGFSFVMEKMQGGSSFMFCEGTNRAALLWAETYSPPTQSRHQDETVELRSIPNFLKKWEGYNVDVSKLKESDLHSFAEYAQLAGYNELKKTLDDLEEEERNEVAKYRNTEEYLKGRKMEVLQFVADGLRAYLISNFPWEESISFKAELPAAPKLSGTSLNDFIECMRSARLPSSPMDVRDFEAKIWRACGGDSGGEPLVLLGSKVRFSHHPDEFYVLEKAGISNRMAGPIAFGENLVIAGGPDGERFKVKLIGGSGPGLVMKDSRFELQIDREDKSKWNIWGMFGKKHVKDVRCVEVVPPEGSWLDKSARTEGLSLEKRAALADYAIANKAMLEHENTTDDCLFQLVLAESEGEHTYALLENAELCEQKWIEILKSAGPFHFQKPDIALWCEEIYQSRRRKFLTNCYDIVEEVIFEHLTAKSRTDLKEECQRIMSEFKQRRSTLLNEFKREASAEPDESRPKIKLERFGKFTRYTGSEAVKVVFQREVRPNERVSWKIAELVPTKADLDVLDREPGHLIAPKLSEISKLVDLDSAEWQLVKALLLSTGQVLIFVKATQSATLKMYLCGGMSGNLQIPGGRQPLASYQRGVDLFCVDETLRCLAFYDSSTSVIKIYRFDEKFAKLLWNGVTIQLASYRGSTSITKMEFIPGKEELLVLDETLCVRFFETVMPGMMKPRTIQLSPSFLQLCLTPDGLCMASVCEKAVDGRLELYVDVYRLDDRCSLMKTVGLGVNVGERKTLHFKVARFGAQLQLLIYDGDQPELLRSLLLKVTVSSDSCHFQEAANEEKRAELTKPSSTCPELDYLFHIFDKYSVSPPLLHSRQRTLLFGLLVRVLHSEKEKVAEKLLNRCKSMLKQLRKEKGKDFSMMKISFNCQLYEDEATNLARDTETVTFGDFLRQLMCLVPVQIARAHNNSLRPLIDGLEVSSDVNYADAIQLADIIRFGVYDAVLESWSGPVKVISSMGKQSSGKSYLLNHLSGSVLDVAGGRCTDGVWMTTRISDRCLYVILDFEGLGSFERSEQEDMLLSILNAAISNITIFNKKDFHLDKETEAVFERFQNGVSLVKDDDKLFKGQFYLAIKDVDPADVEDLTAEFKSKIRLICEKKPVDNFLNKMYGGSVSVTTMPPFTSSEFHESVEEIANAVFELKAVHQNGKSFLRDLKLIISQISSKDWSPMDTKRVAFKVTMVRKNLYSAAAMGVLSDGKQLVDFDTEEPTADSALSLSGHKFEVPDTGLELAPFKSGEVIGTVLEQLVSEFEKEVPRSARGGRTDEEWHRTLESFLAALAERRRERLHAWIRVNTAEFSSDGEVQKLVLEATTLAADVREKLVLCSCKCEECFLHCILKKSHSRQHSCRGKHRCLELCSYCEEKSSGATVNRCRDKAGHEGQHDCMRENHTCGRVCQLYETSSNCNKSCSLKVSHEGEHKCNSRQHMCKMKCSLPSCNNTCVSPVELSSHRKHACHEKMCISKCVMKGCNRKCAVEDHFHSLDKKAVHICGNEHQCHAKCEAKGNCEILTELKKKTRTFVGKRATFEYDHVSEQNGLRKDCCISIPPFELQHPGSHSHTVNPDAVHYCDIRCEGCGYYCTLEMDHGGLHDTTHGNMTQKTFVAESEEVEVEGRKYEWGESGAAEMCMMHCKARGRGHIHLTVCEQGRHADGVCGQIKFSEGVRHAKAKYGPDFDIAKDELTHAAFWRNMRFKDPCSEDDQREFALCGYLCPSAEHNTSAGSSTLQGKSWCTEKLWHDPVPRQPSNAGSAGYVTEDGHQFACNHSRDMANHVIFVVDKSSSMGTSDITPKMVKFPRNRLGCVYEAMVRFIRTRLTSNIQDTMSVVLFDNYGTVGFERQQMTESQVHRLSRYAASGGTTYSSGIALVEQILIRCLSDAAVLSQPPAIIFLSDGGNNGGFDPVSCVNKLKGIEQRLVLHTIMFGKDPAEKILRDMAAAGGGVFERSIDELQLARRFESLAKSLRPKVAALM